MSPRVVLIGLPGAGKSSSGRRLAKILDVPFADSDDLVEASAGRPVKTIFAESGEATFRTLEIAAVAQALIDFDGVLSLGGGAVSAPATQQGLAASGVPVVLLRATFDTLSARVGDGRTRPLLAGSPRERLVEISGVRSPVYERLATFGVDTDGKTPGQVAATVAARLHQRRVLT